MYKSQPDRDTVVKMFDSLYVKLPCDDISCHTRKAEFRHDGVMQYEGQNVRYGAQAFGHRWKNGEIATTSGNRRCVNLCVI